jgi:hypothetical protein
MKKEKNVMRGKKFSKKVMDKMEKQKAAPFDVSTIRMWSEELYKHATGKRFSKKNIHISGLRKSSLTPPEKQKECEHKNWDIYRHCEFKYGYCLDCQKEIHLQELFNSLHMRMEKALAKIESSTIKKEV